MTESMFRKKPHTGTASTSQSDLRCSFCLKYQHEVRKLIAGPTVFICDECIEVCNDIIADEARLAGSAEVKPANGLADFPDSGPEMSCVLCRMPTIASHRLLIQNRGPLCFECIGEIDAAVSDGQEPEP
jgi:hypothetical protein